MVDLNKNYKSKLEYIADIPLAIVEEHHQVFPYWVTSGKKNMTLLHIDRHDDLAEGCQNFFTPIEEYVKFLHIGNFICPAVNYGIIKELFWLNPFNSKREIKGYEEFDSRYIQYLTKENLITRKNSSGYLKWEDQERFTNEKLNFGESITPRELITKFRKEIPSWILDIDLDAFASINYSFGRDDSVIIQSKWEKRVQETIKFLKKMKTKPNLITISRSQGELAYVPEEIVDTIQKRVINDLNMLY